MKRVHKILLILLSLAIVFAGIIVSVSADGSTGLVSYVDANGEVVSSTLEEALVNAKDGTIVKLEGLNVLSEELVVDKDLTIDLNGYNLISASECAFYVSEGADFKIIGNASIQLSGMLVRSEETDFSVTVIGTAGTDGISINHTGEVNNKIVSTYSGKWYFKNMDIVSTTEAVVFDSFFDTNDLPEKFVRPVDEETGKSLPCRADMTFDTVEFTYDVKLVKDTGQFITHVFEEGHLSIINSGFHTQQSGIHVGYANNPEEEIFKIENSVLSCVANTASKVGEAKTQLRTYAVFGMTDEYEGETVGIMNIHNSLVEASYRVLNFENGERGINAREINVYNSTIRSTGLNGEDHSELIGRRININLYDESVIIHVNDGLVGTEGRIVATVGTRTNLKQHTIGELDTNSFNVREVTTEDSDGEQNFKYVTVSKSMKYAWFFDPAGNPDAPYVLIERTYDESVDENGETVTVETTPKSPDYTKYYGFDAIIFKGETKSDSNIITSEGVNSPIYQTPKYEIYYENGNGEGLQLSCRRGTLSAVKNVGDNYLRYWINPKGEDSTETVRNFNSEKAVDGKAADPFFIFGAGNANGQAAYTNHSGRVWGETRKSVVVVDLDFGTDSELGYPEIGITTSARAYDSNGNYNKNVSVAQSFRIKDYGMIVNNLKDAVIAPLKPVNEWNHLTAVFYTDIGDPNGEAYFYLNGQFIGSTDVYDPYYARAAYVQGIRFDVIAGGNHTVNSAICIDNVSYRAYSNYLDETEIDCSVVEDNGYMVYENDGVKHPEFYVTKTSARKYIEDKFSISGVPCNTTVDEAIKAALKMETSIDLMSDCKTTVSEEIVLLTKGNNLILTEESLAADVEKDSEGAVAKYAFNESYNDVILNYYWYIGEYGNVSQMNSDDYYYKTKVKLGHIPTFENEFYDSDRSANDFVNFKVKRHIGWYRTGDESVAEVIGPVTMLLVTNQGDKPIYMYPAYDSYDAVSYVMGADGKGISIAISESETNTAFKNLKSGQTLVLLADTHVDTGTRFSNTDDYLGTVDDELIEIDNDYTSEELQTMKNASAKIAIDLNGYTLSAGSVNSVGTIAHVSSNTTLSVYSSRPGGLVSSYGGSNAADKATGIYAQRIFSVFGGTETAAARLEVYNAHLVIGTVEVNGKTIPGSNLTLYGGVLVEGMVGDNSCSIEVDGIYGIRAVTDSSGAFMTRYYDGTFKVTNSNIVGQYSTSLIDLKNYSDKNNVITAEVLFDNCLLINNGGSLVAGAGDDENQICLTFRNIVTNGKIDLGGNEKFLCEENVKAASIKAKNYKDGVFAATYNSPMSMASLTSEKIYKIAVPVKPDANTLNPEGIYVYVVEAGYEHLVPIDDNVQMLVLSNLNAATVSEEDTVKVTFMGLNPNSSSDDKVYTYVKTSIPTIPAIQDYAVNDLFSFVHDGTFDRRVMAVYEDTVYVPNYKVVAKPAGVKVSVSLSTNFSVNVYLPIEYKEVLDSISYLGVELETKEVEISGTQYIVAVIPLMADDFCDDVVIEYEFSEKAAEGMTEAEIAKLLSAAGTLNFNMTDYATEVLSKKYTSGLEQGNYVYSVEERNLVYRAMNYANEIFEFVYGEENEIVSEMLSAYADSKYEKPLTGSNIKYPDAVSDTGLGALFMTARIKLGTAPEYVFVMKSGFVGTVTVKYGDEEIVYNVDENSGRKIVVSGMSVFDFVKTLTITAEGTIGEEVISITDGKYNLDTFAKAHADIANSEEYTAIERSESQKALSLIEALYEYVEVSYESTPVSE